VTITSLIKDFVYFLSSPLLSSINVFYKKHKGDSCYIFGEGVSVKSMNLGLFDDKIGIANNFLPFHKDFGLTNCSYCAVAAPYFFAPIFGYSGDKRKNMIRMSTLYREIIDKYPDKHYFFNLSNYPFIWKKNIHFMFEDIPDRRLPEDFITKRMFCFSGVMRMSILLAIYMGFEKAYLVGFDYTHVPSRSKHWYDNGKGIFCTQDSYNKDFFSVASEFIDLTTITIDGTSDVVDAVTYETYTGHRPLFRENSDLLSPRHMSALSAWSKA